MYIMYSELSCLSCVEITYLKVMFGMLEWRMRVENQFHMLFIQVFGLFLIMGIGITNSLL